VKHCEGRRRLCRYLRCFTVFGPVFKCARKTAMSLTDTRSLCQSALNQKLRFAKLLGSVSLCQSDRCLFDSDRLGVDRFAVAPESICVAQTPLALNPKIGILQE
jgi:hypothetical protein